MHNIKLHIDYQLGKTSYCPSVFTSSCPKSLEHKFLYQQVKMIFFKYLNVCSTSWTIGGHLFNITLWFIHTDTKLVLKQTKLSFNHSTTARTIAKLNYESLMSSSSVFSAISLGFTSLGEILANVTVFHPTIEVVTFRYVDGGWVFVAGIHLSRTWMSESIESVRWNVCVHRLDLRQTNCEPPKEQWKGKCWI